MIKIKYFFISSVIVVSTFGALSAHGETADANQSSEDLFKKVFGTKQESKKIVIDATLDDFIIGEISVSVIGEKILTISGADLNRVLSEKIRDDKKAVYQINPGEVTPASLPFKIVYYPSELRLALDIPASDLKPRDANVYEDLIPYFSKKAVEPSPFSFGTNYKLEDVQVRKLDQQNSYGAQTDSFMNIKSLTFENQMNYLSTRKTKWYRQNSKMTYDRPNRMNRFELGDVNYPIIGYQQSKTLGGISLYRDFSLNPYRVTGPTSSFEYEVETRSLVRTYVNNIILKTEYMNAGKYSVKDIPLNNGVNKIIIEITDEFGKKKVLIFNEAGSLDLLAPGLSRYSLAGGYPSTDTELSKKYEDQNGAFITGFYQYGATKNWTSGAYAQGNKHYEILGANQIFATRYGNFGLDTSGSKNEFHKGVALQGTYQLNLFGAYWYDSHTLTAKIEHRSPWFNESGDNIFNRYDLITSANYSVPLLEKFNIAVGGNYQIPREGNTPKFGYDTSLTTKVFESSSLTFYFARSKDENKVWSTQLYCFFNMTFGDSATFASAFYEKNSQTKRLTVINDNGRTLNSLKTSASVDDNIANRNGLLDLQYNTTLADVGLREEVINSKGRGTGTRTSMRFLSSFAYVNNGSEGGFSISRPISNSFVIFKPKSDWKGQKFGVQALGETDTETGMFGESLISGLSPYQYRRLQLDPSHLQPGYILGQESFVVYPRYRSGHLFVVGKSGLLVLRGIILDKDQRPQPLKVGFWTSKSGKITPFFTGREGEFFIEGVEPTLGKLQLDDEQFEALELNFEKRKSGLIDIGNIVLPFKESRL